MTRLSELCFDLMRHPARALWLLACAGFLYLASLPVHLASQAAIVATLLVLIGMTARYLRRETSPPAVTHLLRAFIIACAAFVTLRYLFWRTFTTIEYVDPLSLAAALLLYVAELYGITIFLLGAFVNIAPLKRKPAPLPDDPDEYPTVDIMIPSYNEDTELLEVTLIAATQVDYPRDKFNVYLLDDGGTEQKRNDADAEKAAAAWQRHHELQALCERLGATYLTRARNEHAKAGNVNEAFNHTEGEIVLILDADHVPATDILKKTVGFFLKDPKLFLVQTPHFFINPDPIERNLDTFEQMPSENEMFYTVIQHGLDFWNASFFCGSAALLRRRYLEEIGGISGQTITEDAETALGLHERGYRSVYLGTPLISGLQPETFTGFILQRVRWAQGMVQIFLLKNPWGKNRLAVYQRLAYTSSSFFWFFPFARTVYLIAPAAFLLFGLQIYAANLEEFLVYALPHLVSSILLSNHLFGKTRWAFISELYETMQSLFSLVAITKVFRNPHAPKFNVTPKGEHMEHDFVSSLSTPFYVLIGITVACLAAAALRYAYIPAQRDVALITGAWTVFNLILLLGALGALFERRQRRLSPRINVPIDLHARISVEGVEVPCRVVDVSATGAGVYAPVSDALHLSPDARLELVVDNRALGRTSRLRSRVKRVISRREIGGKAHLLVGLEFMPRDLNERRDIVGLVFGDSEVLKSNLFRRQRAVGVSRSLLFLIRTGALHAAGHVTFLFRPLLRRLFAVLRYLWPGSKDAVTTEGLPNTDLMMTVTGNEKGCDMPDEASTKLPERALR